MLNTLQVMDFYLKGLDFGVWMLKTKTKILQATGGTLRIHRRNPNEGSVWSVGPKSGLPRICTGGTQFWDPPDPPELQNLTVRVFDPRDDFQNFRKVLKPKI